MAEHSFKVVKTRLLVFFGGPSLYRGFDLRHDKSWESYIMPMRLYADSGSLPKKDKTKIIWYLYEPAYKQRWEDDDSNRISTFFDDGWHAIFGDSNLARLRDATVEKFKSAGLNSYREVVGRIAAKFNSTYDYDISVESFNSPSDMYSSINAQPDYSIERVWYFGHGIPAGLVLRLSPTRDEASPTKIDPGEIIRGSDISGNKTLAIKFNPGSTESSMFFACNSIDFAREWNSVFSMATEGGSGTLDFAITAQSGTTKSNVLDRLKGTLKWQKIPKK